MSGPATSTSARAWRSTVVLLLVGAWASACGEGQPPTSDVDAADQAAAAAVVDVEEEPGDEPELRPFLPDEMQRSTRPESFPHAAHRQIDCSACHQTPRGHSSHQDVACSACHRASADATLATLTPAECQSCHHGVDQPLGCEACHASRPMVASTQELDLEVWAAPRTRTLDFDHTRHAGVACRSCHQALPALTPAEPCASCHSEHHTAEVRCASCHVEPPAGAHGVEAHLTCSGSGCHRSPEVEAIATTRTVCLACHTGQEGHEPGGDCIECHRVRGDPVTQSPWSHG